MDSFLIHTIKVHNMILIDLNQIVLSNMMQSLNVRKSSVIEEDWLRHMILTAIRSFKTRFSAEYGDVILCSDAHSYWRKDIFPNYKANRKKARENSDIDWNQIHKVLNKLKDEIQENLPYKFMVVPHCEADDIIAVISSVSKERVLIISGDKDFLQLQRYRNVTQYSPVQKMFMIEPDPVSFLEEKIIYGDSGDGIPNILSEDDTFVAGRRQNRITSKFLEAFNEYKSDTSCYERYDRNNRLINFDCIPMEIKGQILLAFEKPVIGSQEKVTKYLQRNRLNMLLNWNGEF